MQVTDRITHHDPNGGSNLEGLQHKIKAFVDEAV